MTLELLFARAAQGHTFLLLAAGGAALGLLLQLSGALQRVCRPLGMALDALCALGAGGLVWWTALETGSGLRGYAALGLLTGLTLYASGIGPLVTGMGRRLQKLFRPRQE